MKPEKQALIVVDYQNDFVPKLEWWTGWLWVEWGWLLAPRINELMRETKTAWGLIIATRDWHPQNHISFASNHPWKSPFVDTLDNWQELWPDHCVELSPWSRYFWELNTSLIDHEIIKGYQANKDAYSGFEWREMVPYDILPNPWERQENKVQEKYWQIVNAKHIKDFLSQAGVETVKIVGLATDFCVRATAVDSVKNGFKTIIDSSAIAWVMIKTPEETIAYLEKLREENWVEYV